MTIIVFLVDTSASMQQRAFHSGRSTLLDVAKGAVEFFVKTRQKSPESRGDRYMLLTFEEYPRNIKAGWKENLQTFMSELKNLDANGMTTLGTALKQVFDTLNINRMQTGIDMYGQGRYPFYLEPAVIVVISDGGKLTTQGSVQGELNLPMHSTVPGSELTREPFRWDQRLYALVLRMAGTPPTPQETTGHVANDHSPVDLMCEVTGGRSYAVTSQRVLHQCIDSLVQKLQSGVVVHFEKIGPDPPALTTAAGEKEEPEQENSLSRADTAPLDELESLAQAKGLTFSKDGSGGGGGGGSNSNSRPHTPNHVLSASTVAWHSCRKLIYVPRSAQKGFAVGFWPLPEAFWPDVNAPALPQRSAHPKVTFSCSNQEPMIIDNLPFDKYELEPSPLTLFILARKQPKVCWQVYIQGSGKAAEGGHAFGYLKASTNLLSVNLFVLPYNYPVLLPLLDDLFKVHRLKPTSDWRNAFKNYLHTMPAYYAGPLRRALTRMGAGNLASTLVPETMDNCLSYTVLNYLKRLKNQAKLEYDKTLNSTPVNSKIRTGPDGIKVIPRSPFKKELLNNHLLRDRFALLRDQLTDFPGFMLGIKDAGLKSNGLRNAFDIPRHSLLDQLIRMRANYLQASHTNSRLVDDDLTHSLPIGQMGNYQDYIKKQPVPLREIESQPVRQHMFGNPFKINKNMILDEVVDEVPVNNMAGGGGGVQQLMGGGEAGVGGRGKKRGHGSGDRGPDPMPPGKRARKGPLPKDFVYRRTPPGTPTHDFSSDSESSPPSSPTALSAGVTLPAESLPPQISPLLPPQPGLGPVLAIADEEQQHEPQAVHPPSISVNGVGLQSSFAQPVDAAPASVDDEDEEESNSDDSDTEAASGAQPPALASNAPETSEDTDNQLPKRPPNQPPALGSAASSLPVAASAAAPSQSSQPPSLARQDAFRLSTSRQEALMTSEISSVIGSGNAGLAGSSIFGGASAPAAAGSKKATGGHLSNGSVNGSSVGPLVNGSVGSPPVKKEPGADSDSDEPALSKEELRSVQLRNQNMRQIIYKEVKRPGRNHERLFDMLRELRGPRYVRRDYIGDVIAEARRFKRKLLAEMLENKMEELVSAPA